MNSRILGVTALGHSTGSGIEQQLAAAIPGVRVRVQGALDGLSWQEIADLSRRNTEHALPVRLLDGSTREIGVEWLHPLVERATRELASAGAGAVLLAHSGEFPECRAPVPVIVPWKIAPREVARMQPAERIAIVAQTEAAARSAAAQWLSQDLLPEVVTWAAPWRPNEVVRALQLVRESSASLVVLDGGVRETLDSEMVARQTGKPVLTLLQVAARAAVSMIR